VSTLSAYVNYSACLHGIDATNVRLRRDERHNALWIELSDDDVDIRVDLNDKGTLGRDLDGLRRLAEVAAQAAQELEQLQQEADR
jgi:hypothetical protein